jgi:hypothetical protein
MKKILKGEFLKVSALTSQDYLFISEYGFLTWNIFNWLSSIQFGSICHPSLSFAG